MKLQKILCLLLCFVLTVPGGVTFISVSASSGVSTLETTFNMDEYDFSDPSNRIPNFPTDEEFFGVWDEETGTWTTESKFNYDYVSKFGYDLSEVESYVKQGDYEKAEEALLKYYRAVNDARGMDNLTPLAKDERMAKLMLYNFHCLEGSSYVPSDIFSIGGEWETHRIGVLNSVISIIELDGTKNMPLGIYSITKDDYEAMFCSKESDYKPYLELVVNGMTERIYPRDDTYIAAGDYRNDSFGDEEYLYSRESGKGEKEPVNSETRRAFLIFDISAYDMGDTISSAELVIRGKWQDKQSPERGDSTYKKKMVVVSDVNDNWTEETFTYMTNPTSIFSYEGEFGTKWIQPLPESNPDQVYEEHMIRFFPLDNFTKVYYDSGDELYAQVMLMYIHHFIETTYNVYRGMEGGWEYPEANWSIEDAQQLLYGGYSKSLDLSVRADNFAKYLIYYYNSEHMTPELFSVLVKYMWSMGNVLSTYYGRSEKAGNWGTYSNKGFYSIQMYYPEFAATPRWEEIVKQRIEERIVKIFLADGSTEEGSLSYTGAHYSNVYPIKELADKLRLDLEFSDATYEGLEDICRYIVSLALPWGGDPGFGDCTPHTGDMFSPILKVADWIDSQELQWICTYGEKGTEPDWDSVYYDFRKMLVMRSDWSKDAKYLYTNTTGSPYSHNHWDTLEIILAAYGEYLLIDPGYFNLMSGEENHTWLVSSRGHNTIEINDYRHKRYIAPTITPDPVLPSGGTKGDIYNVEFNDGYDFATVTTENCKDIQYNGIPAGYDEIPPVEPGMDVNRNILFVEPNFWIVSDYMNPVDDDVENKYTQLWHTLPSANLSIDGQYVLQDGEAIGSISDGELDTQIENTQFVPGTGSGALLTKTDGAANIMVVPADIDTVEPKLMRGLYSPKKGAVVRTEYGLFEKHATGTTGIDTVLFPTRAGETYDIATTPNTLALPQGAGSSFSANIKNTSGTNNDDYSFTYYILHEEDKKDDVVFGSYNTDGTLAYYEEEKDARPRNAIMRNATYIGDNANDYKIVYSEEEVEDLNVKWENGEIILSTSDEIDLSKLTVYSSAEPSAVLLNDEEVEFSYTSNYVYFAASPILNGGSIVLPGNSSVSNPTTPDSDTPSHGTPSTDSGSEGSTPGSNIPSASQRPDSTESSGSSGGGGGGGGGAAISKDEQEEQTGSKSDTFSAELANHWGKTEIEYLVENGIVNGDGSGLNLKSEVTRAEFIAMVIRALGIETVPYAGAFPDVSEDSWYADIMQTAYDKGIISGTDSGAEPQAYLTREQAVKIILSALGTEVSGEDTATEFSDDDEISHWAKQYVSKAVSMGVINGLGDGKFAPKGTALREQAMVMIYRMLNIEEETIK